MKYMFISIKVKEIETFDEHNYVHSLIKGFMVEPIEAFDSKDDVEAVEMVKKNYHALLESYESNEDMEWFHKNMSKDGKTSFISIFKIVEEGTFINWRYIE